MSLISRILRGTAVNEAASQNVPDRPAPVRLWIDGVGTYLLLCDDEVTIGGIRWDGPAADLSLQAGLARQHATLRRDAEDYWLDPHAAAAVNGRDIAEPVLLHDGYEIELAASVRLGFHLPSPLSASARLEWISGHRPAVRTDGVVLMAETCLLGPGPENHIRCRNWPTQFVLVRRGDRLWGRCRETWLLNEHPVDGATELSPGDVISGPEFRLRLEEAAPAST